MLDDSKTTLHAASTDEVSFAEHFARAYMVAKLRENLIPIAEAEATVANHAEARTEEWTRSVFASLAALRAAGERGYRLVGGNGELSKTS